MFFRAGSLGDSFKILIKLKDLPQDISAYIHEISKAGFNSAFESIFQLEIKNFILSAVCIALLILSDFLSRNISGIERIKRQPLIVRWIGYCTLITAIYFNWNTHQIEFIYFVF
jgi:hypothetical protein